VTPAQPFALRLFVPSGMPEGMRIVEKSNWSGIGFVVPSQAAVMLLARSANGLIEWKDAGGLSLREHRQRQVPIAEEVSNG
jgi:hypothetical protein